MILTSDAWKQKHTEQLLPETFVEIECAITETGAQAQMVSSGTNEVFFSNAYRVSGNRGTVAAQKYATLEHNLWTLDAQKKIIDKKIRTDEGYIYSNIGYASNDDNGSVTLTSPELRKVAIPGVTISWCNEYGEYPTDFTVTAYNGNKVVAQTSVHGNTSQFTLVDLEMSDYDRVTVTVDKWCVPNHRCRVEKFILGHIRLFEKGEIMSYSHEQSGDIFSGELPKNFVRFAVDNIDGKWNPANPSGIERYLMERQRLTVRYGMDIDGVVEWIPAGVFYLSEWSAPANGIEASFEARDALEYMMYDKYTGITSGTLYDIVNAAFTQANLPADVVVHVADVLKRYSGTIPDSMNNSTIAEIIQHCANAAGCVIYQDRVGKIHIEQLLKKNDFDYTILGEFSYSYPEIELSKQLRSVVVNYGDNEFTLPVSSAGENQTLTNDLISTSAQAAEIAVWVKDGLESRKNIGGEFRADPCIDVFDSVKIETRYGDIAAVLTDIKYTYSGAFRATYTGRVVPYKDGIYAVDDGNGNVTIYGITATDDGNGNVTLLGCNVTDDGNGNVTIF